ncbi:hypothetical protein H0H87_000729 [Tephrocybe sp. NHM501043]|nr:hypothetical protein H0H87_000729 [Tephrocybe sp. NHM501043]
MSLLGMIVAGALSIVLWFEVASSVDMTGGERAGFVIAGLVETFLFVASSLGFVGAIVRKQLFVQIYAYFIYVHFLLNIGVAAYLLYLVTHFSANAAVKACQETIQNKQAEDQCTGLLRVTQGVYLAIAAIVLLVELYLALVVTRYLNQLRNEKRSARGLRLENEEAFGLVSRGKGRYSALPSQQDGGFAHPVYSSSGPDFDPYKEIHDPVHEERRLTGHDNTFRPQEVDYGGGSWTHAEISSEEKARLQREEMDLMPGRESAESVRWNPDSKTPTGPAFPAPEVVDSSLDPPKYTSTGQGNTLRLLSQFQCSKPRDIDPAATPSLRFFFANILLLNSSSIWSHAIQGAAEGRAIVLDFVGMGYAPSKTQLLALDVLIVLLQFILTTIAYETSLYEHSHDTDTHDMLLPIPSPLSPTPSPLFTPIPPSTPLPMSQHTKAHPPPMISPYVVDLRLAPIIARLRNPPPPPQTTNSDASLPLPNTTPWPLPAGMRMLIRASTQIRRERANGGTTGGTRIPGSLNPRDG